MKVGICRFNALFILFSLLVLFLSAHSASAQTQGAGIKVIPAFIENDGGALEPGTTIERTIQITNTGPDDKEYFVYKRNIIGVGEGGVPEFAEDGVEQTGFELTEWINFQTDPIQVKAGETLTFPITIAIPSDAPPCSHFGGIFVSAEPPRLRQNGAGVGYEVGTIVNLLVAGECIEDARVRAFSTDRLFYATKDVNFTAKIENQGNILIRPRGPLEIRGMFGDPVVVSVNDSLAGVFPRTVRDFNFSWNEEGIGFGRYEAVLALAYETAQGQKTIDASVVFWVFPIKVLLPILIGFVAILLTGYFLTRYYINQAIMRAQGGRRITTYRYRKQVGISRLTFVFVVLMGVMVIFLIILLILFA